MQEIPILNPLVVTEICYQSKSRVQHHRSVKLSSKLKYLNVFDNFRNMCLEIYDIDPAKFVSFPGLAWQAALNKAEVKSDLLTDIDMLLMVEKKSIRGPPVTRFINMKNLVTNTQKVMIKINNHMFIMGM